jgi:hypothetical protein
VKVYRPRQSTVQEQLGCLMRIGLFLASPVSAVDEQAVNRSEERQSSGATRRGAQQPVGEGFAAPSAL